ncbi:hypothetical protein [Succinimonas sp.]|uniref:hypothetical protein n=1 Tax=Succinimonas sp. TaxID=1936151 RepID=UPI00386B5B60
MCRIHLPDNTGHSQTASSSYCSFSLEVVSVFIRNPRGAPGICETIAYKEQNMIGAAIIWILTHND